MSTCGECKLFVACDHHVNKQGGYCSRLSTACFKFTPRCPLPRIGSKAWGWNKNEHGDWVLEVEGLRYVVWGRLMLEADCGGICLATGLQDAAIAKRFCELHARRQWHLAHGKGGVK